MGFPPKYRKITIDTESRNADVTTIIPEVSELDLKMKLFDYCKEGFLGGVAEIPYYMEHDVNKLSSLQLAIPSPAAFFIKHKLIAKKAGKFLNNLTFGKLGKWTRRKTNLKNEDYENIKNQKVFTYIVEVFASLYNGNADTEPQTPKYKIVMATIEKLDTLIKVLPFNLKKITGYYSLKTILEPLIFNSGIDDDNANLIL